MVSNCDEHLKNIYDKISCFLLALNDSCFKFKYTENGKDYFVSGEKTATNSLEASYFLDDFYSKKESVSLLKVNKLNIERDIRGHLNKLNKKFEWTMQLHVNVNRSINGPALSKIGENTGFDSKGYRRQAKRQSAAGGQCP